MNKISLLNKTLVILSGLMLVALWGCGDAPVSMGKEQMQKYLDRRPGTEVKLKSFEWTDNKGIVAEIDGVPVYEMIYKYEAEGVESGVKPIDIIERGEGSMSFKKTSKKWRFVEIKNKVLKVYYIRINSGDALPDSEK